MDINVKKIKYKYTHIIFMHTFAKFELAMTKIVACSTVYIPQCV